MTDMLSALQSATETIPQDSSTKPIIHWQPVTRWRLDGYDLAGTAWGAPHLRHLFGRAAFGLTVAELNALLPSDKTQSITKLLADDPLPAPPGDWVTEPYDPAAYRSWTQEQQRQWQQTNRTRLEELRNWWIIRMAITPLSLREKMVFFWHGHFTSEIRKVDLAQWAYLQNHTLRQHALGNFRDFLKAIYKDPAMLIYLDGIRNIDRQPNENFARELLELFTMGVGNYTEQDIKEAARAFSGWQIDSRNIGSNNPNKPVSFLNRNRHDSGAKTFFGNTGNLGGDEIIDIILEQPVVAEFICTKLYKFFVSHEIDQAFVTELANIFRQNNYEIKPVLRAIFESDHFYSDHAIAALIKSPIEMAVSSARLLHATRITPGYLIRAATALDQELMNPPNVAGWPGQRNWISPTTFVTRNAISETYIMGGSFDGRGGNRDQIEVDAMVFARSFGVEKADELVENFSTHLLRYPIDDATRDYLITVLVGTADPDDWSLNYPGAETQVKQCLVELMRLPEFQLA